MMHLIVYNMFTFTARLCFEIFLLEAACCVLCKKILNTGSVGGDKNMTYKKRNYAFFYKICLWEELCLNRLMSLILNLY